MKRSSKEIARFGRGASLQGVEKSATRRKQAHGLGFKNTKNIPVEKFGNFDVLGLKSLVLVLVRCSPSVLLFVVACLRRLPTRVRIELHHFSCGVSSTWELITSPNTKLEKTKKLLLVGRKFTSPRYIQHENHAQTTIIFFLRFRVEESPIVIQKPS